MTPSRTDPFSRVALALTLAWLACAGPATAAPKAAGKAAAKKEAQAAKRAFDLGKFDVALEHYEEAYRLMSVPALFFNIGQCHRQLGNDERAAYFFRRYLESRPPAAQAKATQALLEQVEAAAAEKKKKAEADTQAARQMELERTRVETARAQAEAAAQARRAAEAAAAAEAQKNSQRNKELEAALLAKQQADAAEQDAPVTKRWWFWTGVAAVVAAGVGTGVYLATAPRPLPTTFPDINGR